jgi:hypothetical protein
MHQIESLQNVSTEKTQSHDFEWTVPLED